MRLNLRKINNLINREERCLNEDRVNTYHRKLWYYRTCNDAHTTIQRNFEIENLLIIGIVTRNSAIKTNISISCFKFDWFRQ